MTLYINVNSIEKLQSSGVLVVEGSKAGLLSTQQISSDHEFNPPFLIKCASDDTLNFRVSKDLKDFQNGNFFAQGSLPGFFLAKKWRSQIMEQNNPNSNNYDQNPNYSNANYSQSQPNNQPVKITNPPIVHNSIPHQIQLEDPNQQNAGIIKCTVSFDRVSHFQGQLCTASQKYPSVIRRGRQKLTLYKGKCPTKNLFSMIDPACQDQQMKFIESIYKDGDEVV